MPDATSPLSEVCLCGSEHWHAMVGDVVWCRRCGSMRPTAHRYWRVPLDRAGELSWAVIVEGGEGDSDEPPTQPGTPAAKRGGG
jgi:hypothetical protein